MNQPTTSKHSQSFWCFVHAGLSMIVIGVLSLLTHSPFLFPALGASTFIMFSAPLTPGACPRNAVCAHVLGATVGWLCYLGFGLDTQSVTLLAGGSWAHVAAPALALAVTCGLMLLLDVAHPPAGATTLIFSLGFLPHVWQIPIVGAGVALVALLACLIHRLNGCAYPLWSARPVPATRAAAPDPGRGQAQQEDAA